MKTSRNIAQLYLLTVMLLALPFASNAQMIHDTILVSEISILTDRTLGATAMKTIEIDSATFANYKNDDLTELLTKSSNLIIKSYGMGNLSTVSFRGTGASHTQVKWNGMNINSPLTGQVDFSVIPVAFIDEVSIKPGNSSLTDQSGGLGGGIVINNRVNWDTTATISVSKELSSFSGNSTYLQFKQGTKKVQYKTRLGYEYAKNDFPFISATLPRQETRQQNGSTNLAGLVQEVYFKPNAKNHLSILGWYSMADRNLSPLMSYEGSGHRENSNDKMLNACFKWDHYNKQHKWHFQTGVMNRNNQYYLYKILSGGTIFNNYDAENNSTSVNNQLKYTWQSGNGTKVSSSLDMNYHTAEISDNKNQTSLSISRKELLFSAIANQAIGEQLAVFTLIRSELVDDQLTPFIPSAGIEYHPAFFSSITVQLNTARNYHHPTLFDLHYQPGGNPDLKPETGFTSECNIIYESGTNNKSVHLVAGVYNSVIDNWILWTDTDYGYWTPVNIQKVVAKGFESSVDFHTKLRSVKADFNFTYNYSSTTSEGSSDEFIKVKGQQLIYIPKHSLRVSANLKNKSWMLHIANQYTGERPVMLSVEGDYKTPLSAYSILDAHIGHFFTAGKLNMRASFKVHNLLDVAYQTIYMRAMPGRYYSVLMSVEI